MCKTVVCTCCSLRSSQKINMLLQRVACGALPWAHWQPHVLYVKPMIGTKTALNIRPHRNASHQGLSSACMAPCSRQRHAPSWCPAPSCTCSRTTSGQGWRPVVMAAAAQQHGWVRQGRQTIAAHSGAAAWLVILGPPLQKSKQTTVTPSGPAGLSTAAAHPAGAGAHFCRHELQGRTIASTAGRTGLIIFMVHASSRLGPPVHRSRH